jgi:hypothetical protein
MLDTLLDCFFYVYEVGKNLRFVLAPLPIIEDDLDLGDVYLWFIFSLILGLGLGLLMCGFYILSLAPVLYADAERSVLVADWLICEVLRHI